MDLAGIAADHLASFGTALRLERPSARFPGFTPAEGYAVAHLVRDLRRERGELPIGRKIGGTNPATYHLTGATGPMWSFMYSSTVRELPTGTGVFDVCAFPQSRIEPELVLHLATAPAAGMDEHELLACVDRVAQSYEFVYSPYSDWQVGAADATAAFGMHQACLIGPWVDISANRAEWGNLLRELEVHLTGSNGAVRQGVGKNALGSPILALKAVVDEIAANPAWTPISADEVITTGTLTELMPVIAGDTWTTVITGAPLQGITVKLTLAG